MSTLRQTGSQLPTDVQMLHVLDQAIVQVGEQVEPQVMSAYKVAAPGGVAGVVRSRVERSRGYKLLVYLGGKSIYTAAGYFTNFGTGEWGPTKAPIRRRPGTGRQRSGAKGRGGNGGRFASAEGPRPPFRLKNGAVVGEIKGQRPQGWVDNARRQADASARVIVESQTDERVSDLMRKALR